MSSVQGPTLVAPKVLEAATKQVFNTRADIAFEEKISNHGLIVSVFLRIAHFFGWYGEVKGKDSLKAERISIGQLEFARANVITLLAKTAIIRPSDATDLGNYQAQGATPEQVKIREDLDKAIVNFYSKLSSRITELTGTDLSKDGVAETQIALYQAGREDLSRRIGQYNANPKNKNAPISSRWNQIINTHIAQNVRFDLAGSITPALILAQGPQALGRIVDQYIKLFGGSDVSAQTLVKALREEVITKYGKDFDTAAKQLGINKAPKEAVIKKDDAIRAERNAAKDAVKALNEKHVAIAKQVAADNKELKNAKTVLKDREAEFGLFQQQLQKRFPALILSENPETLLKTVKGLNTEGLNAAELVVVGNARKCAESLLKARQTVATLQANGGVIKTNIALLDEVSARIAKAEKTIAETSAKLQNVEAIVKAETDNRIKQLGYFASRDSIGSDAFVALVYPKAEAQKPAAAEAPKANAGKKKVSFDTEAVDKTSKQFSKEIYPKKELSKIAKEGEVIETTSISDEELEDAFTTKKPNSSNLSKKDFTSQQEIANAFENEINEKTHLLYSLVASDEYDDEVEETSADAAKAPAATEEEQLAQQFKAAFAGVANADAPKAVETWDVFDEVEETSADTAKALEATEQEKLAQQLKTTFPDLSIKEQEQIAQQLVAHLFKGSSDNSADTTTAKKSAKAPAILSLFDSIDFRAPEAVGKGKPLVEADAPKIADIDFLSGNGVTYVKPQRSAPKKAEVIGPTKIVDPVQASASELNKFKLGAPKAKVEPTKKVDPASEPSKLKPEAIKKAAPKNEAQQFPAGFPAEYQEFLTKTKNEPKENSNAWALNKLRVDRAEKRAIQRRRQESIDTRLNKLVESGIKLEESAAKDHASERRRIQEKTVNLVKGLDQSDKTFANSSRRVLDAITSNANLELGNPNLITITQQLKANL
jgi:hypothetical protein